MKTFCLALDLVDDPKRIEEYEEHHKKVAPEIIKSIKDSGITNMVLYRTGNRLFMIIEAQDQFSFEAKSQMDASNPAVQVWEALMDTYQQRLPWSSTGDKWVLMDEIFNLKKNDSLQH
jgi:L-rhamnose mutarotase